MPPESAAGGASAHFRGLESLYRQAAINRLFRSEMEIAEPGVARIRFDVDPSVFHAAGAAHGTLFFKMMDDAAFYACNSMVSDRFLLTTAFNLVFLLLSPPDAGVDHLKALASVSRTFRDRQVLAKLRGARSKDALFALLVGEEKRDAA